MSDERLDLLDALLYGDVFDCAVTLDELRRYARVAIDREELRRRLREDPALRRLVRERGGLYCLEDRPHLLERRAERARRARQLERRARRVARLLRHAPYVRGLALTGSTAAGDAGEEGDVDLLVTVAPGRLGTVFLVLGSLSRIVGRRLFCPNYYVCEDRLRLGPATLYLGRELAQARHLAGDGSALWEVNPWLREMFPNAAPPVATRAARTALQRALEPLLGPGIERWARLVARARLRAHYGTVPADVEEGFAAGAALRFHGSGVAARTLERYAARRGEIAARLDREQAA